MAVHTVRTAHGELTLNLDRDYIVEALGPALSTGAIDGWVAALLLREPNVSSILIGSEAGQTFVEIALVLAIIGIVVASALSLGWLG